ncbi:MAG: DNA-binding domain-containing protein [Myxococcota bacterium]
MTDARALLTVQSDFARFVMTLDRTDEPVAKTASDGRDDIVARLRSDREISASERIQVYENAYFARIHGVLREDYSALHAAIGDDAFHDLAKLYLMAHPSRSFSLRFAGERLAEFLSGPVAEPFSRRWPFASDLAALEWALVDVFDARDATVLDRAALAAVAPEDWAGLRFALVPAHCILSLAWPVHRVRDAWSSGAPLPELESRPTRVLVHRHAEAVLQRTLSLTEAHALERVRGGQAFGTVCAGVLEQTGDEDAAGSVIALLERWLAEGLLAALEPSSTGRDGNDP